MVQNSIPVALFGKFEMISSVGISGKKNGITIVKISEDLTFVLQECIDSYISLKINNAKLLPVASHCTLIQNRVLFKT